MNKVKSFVTNLVGRFRSIKNPSGELEDKQSLTFFIDMYCLVFTLLIMFPFTTFFNITVVAIFIINFALSADPFIKHKKLPKGGEFFKDRPIFGKIIVGYFLLLFLTFIIAFIHSRFLRGVGLSLTPWLAVYYILVFGLMPIVLGLVAIGLKVKNSKFMKYLGKFFIICLTFIFICGSGNAFAAYSPGDYIIYTWGYADIMWNMLSAIAGVMNSHGFFSLFKLGAMLALLMVAISFINAERVSTFVMGAKITGVILMQIILTAAPYDTYIADVSRTTGSASLSGEAVRGPRGEKVPIIVSFPLYVISNIEKGLYDIFKDNLSRTKGMVVVSNNRTLPITTSLNLLLATSSYRMTDLNLNRSLEKFVENCIVPDMISGYFDMEAMGKSDNFFNEWQDVHRMRITNYYDAARNGYDGWIIDCQDAYRRISADINRATGINGEAFKQIASSVGLASDKTIHDQLGIISQELMNYTGGAQGLMRNAIAVNSFNSAYMSIAAEAGVNFPGLNYGQVKAQEVARMNSTLSAIMAKQYLPLAKGYLSVIFVSVIPIILIIGLVTGSFKKPFAMIIGLLTALSLWGIGEQLLDFIITIRIGGLLQSTGGLGLANQPIVDMGILNALSLSLGMYWTVPTLAFAIATMSGYAANSIMGGIGSSVMSGLGAAASEGAMGSRSMGIVRENMINTNKFDAARNDTMGVYTSVKHGVSNSTENVDNLAMTTSSKGIDEKDMNWKTENNMRYGEGMVDGNFMKVTQYMGSDGEWKNQEVKTTYGDSGADIQNDRGGFIHLGAGATSTQYADGTTSYSGVSEKFGKVEAVYGADGEVGMVNGMKGHEFFNKHNSINQDFFTSATNVSNEYTGEMMVNGEKAFGKYVYDKEGKQGRFSGQIGNDKVDMTLDNVKDFQINRRGEVDSLASVNGDVGQMSVNGSKMEDRTEVKNTGKIENTHLDEHNITGGKNVTGYNASNAMIKNGLSQFRGQGFDNAFFDNHAKYLNSIAKVTGDDKLSTDQALSAFGGIKASGKLGAEIFGNGASMEAFAQGQIKANLQHGSSTMRAVDFNRVMVEGIANGLDTDKAAGKFNDENGNYNPSLYDQVARDRYGALEASLKEQYDMIKVPGSGIAKAVDAVTELGGKALDAASSQMDKIEERIDKGMKK